MAPPGQLLCNLAMFSTEPWAPLQLFKTGVPSYPSHSPVVLTALWVRTVSEQQQYFVCHSSGRRCGVLEADCRGIGRTIPCKL